MTAKNRRSVFILLAALIFALQLCGCMRVDQENRTTLNLSGDGTIRQVIVDDADETVTGEELEDYINEEITAFHEANSGENVALESCRVGMGKVNITLTYSSAETYAAFNNVTCFEGTIKQAYDSGYDFNRAFYAVNGMTVPYIELSRYCNGCRVLIIEESALVDLPGDLYIMSGGVSVDEDGQVSTAAQTDESYAEEMQAVNIERAFLIYKAS